MSGTSGGRGQPTRVACEPEVLYAEHEAAFSSLAVRDGYVYFVNRRTNELSRIAREGGYREHVASGVLPAVHPALDAEHLFLASLDYSIRRITPDGTEDVGLAPTAGGVSTVQRDGQHVYWMHSLGNSARGTFLAQVHRTHVEGGEMETLWTGAGHVHADGLAVSGEHMFVASFQTEPNGPPSNGQIVRISETREVVPWVTGLRTPVVHGADERYVYFTAQRLGGYDDLWRVPVAGGTPELLHRSTYYTSVSVGQMLIRGDRVWWAEALAAEGIHLYLAVPGKTEATALVTLDEGHLLGLAGDEHYLYFASSADFEGTGPAILWRLDSDCSPG